MQIVIVYKLKDWNELINTQFNNYDRALHLIKSPNGKYTLSKSDYEKYKNKVFFHTFSQFDTYEEQGITFERWMMESYEAEFIEDVNGFTKICSEINGKLIDLMTMEEITNKSENSNYSDMEINDLASLLWNYDNMFSKTEDYSSYTKGQLWKIIENLVGLIDTTVEVLNKYRGVDKND